MLKKLFKAPGKNRCTECVSQNRYRCEEQRKYCPFIEMRAA